jgi:hypothetical protein
MQDAANCGKNDAPFAPYTHTVYCHRYTPKEPSVSVGNSPHRAEVGQFVPKWKGPEAPRPGDVILGYLITLDLIQYLGNPVHSP